MTRLQYILRELRSNLWIKPSIMGLSAAIWVSIAYSFAELIPEKFQYGVKRDILLNLLGILASTMLTVATFSVSAMVGAFGAVSNSATPRATHIVMSDRSSQNALTSFLCAFIYAIIALVALSILEYGNGGRLLLFAAYVLIVLWVLVSFVRWVDRISNLGRMGDTLERVEEACDESFSSPQIMGTFGAKPVKGDAPEGIEIYPEKIGYLLNVDVSELNEAAEKLGATIRLHERPGAFLDKRDSMAVVFGGEKPDEDTLKKIKGAFQTGDTRRLGADPRFGLILFSEIAARALSPAVNDPGTAIAVLGIQIRLLEKWNCQVSAGQEDRFPNVEVPVLEAEDLMDDAFTAISRDGAGIFEVGCRLQKGLSILTNLGNPQLSKASARHSQLALEQSDKAVATNSHKETLRELAAKVSG